MNNEPVKGTFPNMNELLKAMSNAAVSCFCYDIADGVMTVPEECARDIGCDTKYENMPYSFADKFIHKNDKLVFINLFENISDGAGTAEAVYRHKDGIRWRRTTLTVTERDGNGKPLCATGIAADIPKEKNRDVCSSKWVDAVSEIYHVRCYVDLVERTYVSIGSSYGNSVKIPKSGNSGELVRYYADNFVYPEDRAEYLSRLNADYIRSRLNTENRSFSVEYRQLDGENGYRWVRGMIIIADALEDGTPHHVAYTVQYIDEEMEEKALLSSSLSLMRDTYYRIGCIDIDRNSMRTITISDSERSEASAFSEDFRKAIQDFSKSYVLEEYRPKFLNIMLPERMKNTFDSGVEYIDITYRRLESGVPKWVRTELVPLAGYSPGSRRVMWYVKNISDEKAVENRLTQKLLQMNTNINLQMETILEGITGGFKISADNEKSSYVYVSESTAELFGYPDVKSFTDAVNGSALNLVYGEDKCSVAAVLKHASNSGGRYSVKYRARCKDGSLKWIVDSGKRIVTEDGEARFYSFYHDVTELESRNTDLRDALSMNKLLVNSVNCGIFSYRLPRREILILNSEAKRLFGIDSEQVKNSDITKAMRENILPEDIARMSNAVKVLNNPGDRATYELRMRNRDGNIYKVRVNSDLLEFDDGGRFIISSLLDITDMSELTEIIKEERSQYRDALMTNCEYAFSFDVTKGYITEEFVTSRGINPFRRAGLELPVHIDKFVEKWKEIFRPRFLIEGMDNELRRDFMLKKFAHGERTGEAEYYSGITDVYTRITYLLSRSERNGHIMAVVVGTDTTERRRMEEKTKQVLMDAYESARRANAAKSDFLSRMSHDIRTPMNAIIGMTAIAGTHLDDRERVTDCLNKITVSSGHLLSLINEVLDMSKIESGRIDLNEEEFNLSDLVDALISMVRPQIKAKNQNFEVTINDVVHEMVIGDKMRIQQSFLNFMSNAIKYTPEGGNISLRISEKPVRQGSRTGLYEFIFEDTGIGMEPEFVEHIFEPFARASDSRVSKEYGTGLGMAIADNLVRMMNGKIKVESEVDKGSKFTVTITLRLQDTDELSYEAFADLPVLVADDEQTVCENACNMLEELGMKGEWVLDGKAAVEKTVRRHKDGRDYFAVILDWKMPGMDGVAAAREIRKAIGPDVPIIIISAYDWSDIEPEARAAGVDAFVGKPLFKSRLAHLFRDMLHGTGEVSENDAGGLADENYAGRRVLLVEDNELNAEIAEELLEMTGLAVETAENGQIAVDKFDSSEAGYYDMIFMDVQMPVMNGIEATRAIRSLPRKDAKGIPIVAMTANAFSDDVQAAMNAGMSEYIAKPLDLKLLAKTLEKWLQ